MDEQGVTAPSITAEEETVRAFFSGWAGDEPRAAFETYLDDDCAWFNTGLPPLKGKEACLSLVDVFLKKYPRIEIDILNIGSTPDVIFVERIDRCLDANGDVAATIEVAGVLTLERGRIVRWCDYFDPSPFATVGVE